jgi:hypothetical protein
MSILDKTLLSSSLSIRSFTRLGSGVSTSGLHLRIG